MNQSPTGNERARIWSAVLVVIGLATFGLAGCGDDASEDETTTTAASTATSAESTTSGTSTSRSSSTTEATTSTAQSTPTTGQSSSTESTGRDSTIAVDYRCGSGETGTVSVPTTDIEAIDEFLNTLDFCEFRGGVVEISFVAPCPSGDREVTVTAVDGAIPDIATLDLCENP